MFERGKTMKILIIDGQGGGIGSGLVEQLRGLQEKDLEIWAVGANVTATTAMLRAGADTGATGENAVLYNSSRADVILGPVGIVMANAMMGEISPAMAAAVSGSEARKILIPISKCVQVVGVEQKSMQAYLAEAAAEVKRLLKS